MSNEWKKPVGFHSDIVSTIDIISFLGDEKTTATGRKREAATRTNDAARRSF